MPPVTIRYDHFAQNGLARQLLVFEYAPPFAGVFHGRGVALLELADGRVFFLRTSLPAMKGGAAIESLLGELHRLPAWVTDWDDAAEAVGFEIGAPLEFIGKDPSRAENWNIAEWKRHAATWLAINRSMASIQQMSAIIAHLLRQLSHELAGKLAEFMDKLARRQGASPHGTQPHSWHSGHSTHNYFVAGSEQQRRYRRQADATFPLISGHLFAHPKDQSTLSIIQAIDNGAPLVEHLAGVFNCPKKCIRHLVGVRIEDVGMQWSGRLRELLTILGSLDMNRLPNSKEEWSVFGETVDLLSALTKLPATSVSSRLLLGERAKLNWRRGLSGHAGFRERALAIERFSENFRQAIIATAWMNGKTCDAVAIQRLVVATVCSLGLARLERLAQKWAVEERRFDTTSIIHQERGFPVILEQPLEAGGLKIVQLTTPGDLASEAERMRNCAANYAALCTSGRACIFSVRDGNGIPRVTVEYRLIKIRAGMPQLELIQQKGIENSAPDMQYGEALDALHRYTTSPPAKRRLLDLAAYHEGWRKARDSNMAAEYLRALEFISFVKTENLFRLDFEKIVAEVAGNA